MTSGPPSRIRLGPSLPSRTLRAGLIGACLAAAPLRAQHEGHGAGVKDKQVVDTTGLHLHWQLAGTPVVTRASRTAGHRSLTEGYLAHGVAMLQAATRHDGLALTTMLNSEGLTLQRGELATGVFGEGYVDRRHPHAYVHEAMLAGTTYAGPAALSLAVGRGFAPFGSDDPLVRPFEKFPVNHHHAQILERVLAIGAVRVGDVTGEVGTFNGDEPLRPSSWPRWRRFGDSWSTRLTWRPSGAIQSVLGNAELSGSYAFVRSPEDPDRIVGLDQRKWHAAFRLERPTPLGGGYLLTEWAHTGEYDEGRPVVRYESLLAEGAVCGRWLGAGLRLERTERHETQRLTDLFRYPVPHDDVQIIGVTRWRAATVRLGTPVGGTGVLRAAPFVEASVSRPEDRIPRQAFSSLGFFGGRDLWMVSAGARVTLGGAHGRMGRYGVAAPPVRAYRAPMPGC